MHQGPSDARPPVVLGWPGCPISETQTRADLQLARGGGGAGDHAVVPIALDGAVGVQRGCGKGGIRNGERRRIGQVEGFAAELELDPSFFEAEGAGNVLVHVEQARAAQEVSAGGPERPHGGVGEGGPVEIWGIGVVASPNPYYRAD